MTHSNIYPIYDVIKCMKGLVLWNHNCWTSISQGSHWIFHRSFSEHPVIMVHQKPEALNQTMTYCNKHLKVKHRPGIRE